MNNHDRQRQKTHKMRKKDRVMETRKEKIINKNLKFILSSKTSLVAALLLYRNNYDDDN